MLKVNRKNEENISSNKIEINNIQQCLNNKQSHLFEYYWKRGKCKGSKCSLCGYIDRTMKPIFKN